MRDGKTVQTEETSKFNQEQIIRLMVGREIEQFFPSVHSHPGEEILRLEGIWKAGKLHDIHLRLRRGEIIGLTGLMGAGRTELARVIFGADQPDGGKIVFQGKEVVLKSPRQAIDSGIGLLTEDRKTQGLVLNMLVRENTTLANLSRLVKRGFIDIAGEKKSHSEVYSGFADQDSFDRAANSQP